MFRLSRLEITNIRSIEHLVLDIDPDGTTALFGPSGSGKSGILDAIPWCLWGDTGAAGTAAALRREGSTTPAEVTATIKLGDSTITATRRLTRSKKTGQESASAKLSINGVAQQNVTAASLTRTITELTGLTAPTFRAAFYMAQDRLTDLMTGTPAKVQAVFEELTGLDQLTKVIDQLKSRYKEARLHADALPGDPHTAANAETDAHAAANAAADSRAYADGLTATAQAARQKWLTADQHARDLRAQVRAAQNARTALAGADAVHAAARNAVGRTAAAVAAAGGDPADAAHGADAARADAARLDAAITALTRAGANLNAAREHAAAAENDLTAAQHAADALPDTAAELASTETRARNVSRTVEAATVDYTRATEQQQTLTDALDTLTGASGSHCPTCQQTMMNPTQLIAGLRGQLADAQQKTARAADRLAQARHREHAVNAEVLEVRRRHDQARHTRARVDNARTRKAEVAKPLAAACSSVAALAAAHGHQAGDAMDATQVRTAALATHRDLTAAVTAARQLAAAWGEHGRAVAAVDEAARDADAARQALRAIPATLDTDTDRAEQDATRARTEFDTRQQAAADASAAAHAAEVTALQLADVADDARTRWAHKQQAAEKAETAATARDLVIALRRDLLTEYCEAISSAATDVMLTLGGEHVGFILDQASFTPQVVLPDGTKRATRLLSGGEKARAAACAFIGISRQLAGGGAPGMILADEITAAQDEAFRRDMLAMLRSLQMPMIVVSHTADVLDIASTVIRLRRPALGSTTLAA